MADATTGTVIVALPAADDPVHGIGDEQKHATLCFLGDDLPAEQVDAVRQAVADHVAAGRGQGVLGPFTEKVSGVESLGDKGARVWMIDSDDGLADIHDELAAHPAIAGPMGQADQFPTYTPHVTIGYPAAEDAEPTAATQDVTRHLGPLDDATEKAAGDVRRIRFDRLAVWSGDQQHEYPLGTGVGESFHAVFEQLTVEQQVAMFPDLLEVAGVGVGNEARLKKWWRENVHWGVGGDFDECVRKATDIFGRHGVAIEPKRWCAALHKEFTGATPGHAPGEHHESAEETPVGDDLRLVETVTITEAAAKEARATGEFPIQFISPGWGSSGYYSPQTIVEAAAERVIPKGTHMYADHPTDAEVKARPARSIKDLMAVTTEDAHLSPSGALVGRAKVVPGWQPFVEAVAPHIGVSIRGEAKDIREGVAEGRKGRIIEGLRPPVASVDFVTRAGRGGRVLELLESAVTEDVDISEDLDLALYEAKYDAKQLRKMAADGHAMENPDGDPAYPIADETDLRNAIHAVGRGSGDHGAIRAHIVKRAKALGKSSLIPEDWSTSTTEDASTDVPATRPGDKKEARMGMKEIEESEFTRLTEQAGRVDTLEAALSKAQGELTEARAALVPNKDLRDRITGLVTENAQLRAEKVAAPMIAEALEDAFIGEAAKGRIARELLEGITLKDGDEKQKVLDTDALTEAINTKVRVAEAEAQELREAMGVGQVGRPRGLGAVGGGLLVEQKLGEYTDTTAGAISKAFGLSEATAKTAATGR